MRKLSFFLSASLFSLTVFAQALVSGRITDAESGDPLPGASVFAQNTTKGTATNSEGLYRLSLNKGGYELIISFTGYESKTIPIQAAEDKELNLTLKKKDDSMSEVVIKSSNEVPDGWEKYGEFFIKHFIGATPLADSCMLQNPQALKFFFFKRNNRLKILATEPLQISNRALGYHLRYELDSFVHYFGPEVASYRGHCLYTPMEGNADEQQVWAKARAFAYPGSRLHFLRSYYDSTLKKEGFTVDLLSPLNPSKFDRLVNPYDTTYYFYNDSTEQAELWFPVKASITYTKKAPEKAYLQQYGLPLDVKMQLSYITLRDGILVEPNGYFFDQQSWVNQGYWSWKNLADQLPYDYEP